MLKDQTTAKGTPLFMAPEVMMFREFNESSDVYSFAIVLWEVCVCGVCFFGHTTTLTILCGIVN